MPYWLKTFSTGHTVDGLPAITSSQSSTIVSILVSHNHLLAQPYHITPSNGCVWFLWGARAGVASSVLVGPHRPERNSGLPQAPTFIHKHISSITCKV